MRLGVTEPGVVRNREMTGEEIIASSRTLNELLYGIAKHGPVRGSSETYGEQNLVHRICHALLIPSNYAIDRITSSLGIREKVRQLAPETHRPMADWFILSFYGDQWAYDDWPMDRRKLQRVTPKDRADFGPVTWVPRRLGDPEELILRFVQMMHER